MIKKYNDFIDEMLTHSPIMGDFEEWFAANEESLRADEYQEYIKEMEFEGINEIQPFEEWAKDLYDELMGQ